MIDSWRPNRVYYGWIIVAVTFLAMLGASGVRSAPGVLIVPLEQAFGWDRPTLSLAISINLLLFGFVGPFAAAIMERIGMRAIMTGALLLMATSVGLSYWMSSPWHLNLLWGLLVGLGSGTLSGWVAATVSSRWFTQSRGLVVGILTVANAAGQLVFLPLLAWLSVTFGWQSAIVMVSLSILAVIPLVMIFMRNHPQELGLRPYGSQSDVPQIRRSDTGNPFRSAFMTLRRSLANRDFLLLSGTFFICGLSTNGLVGIHLIPASIERGFPEVVAASFLALIGVFNIFGTLMSGWLSDRIDNRKLLSCYYGLRGLSLIALPFAYELGTPALLLFVIFYGLDWVATVPPTVRLASDLFGKQHAGQVFAWVFAVHQLGAATAAYGAGLMRSWLGNYTASFILVGFIALLGAVMAQQMSSPSKDKTLSPAAASD